MTCYFFVSEVTSGLRDLNTQFSQQARQGRLSTVLGPDALVLLRLDGHEEMSGDFEWRVEALSADPAIDLHALLGSHATVEIDHADGTRFFDGIVCEAEGRGNFENGNRYDLVLRPWLHVAGLRRNMRIFHNRNVIEIVEEVLMAYAALGAPHLEVATTASYPQLEYTVQWGESDADFVRRQLERHGISWSWTHRDGVHTLLLTDAAFSLPEVPGGSRPYYGVGGYHRHEEEHFRSWGVGERMTTGAVRLTEYNFKTPLAAQEVDQTGTASHPSGDTESYDWPGDYLEQAEGRDVVVRRLEEERGQAPRHRAEGDLVTLGAGWRVTLAGDKVPGATGKTFVCLRADHTFRSQGYGSGDAGGDEAPYAGSYVLTPEDTPYRPERRTQRAKVEGPETAVVVGEGEIDCDEYGRILCQFHWDLEGAHTMRVRVSQNWASKGWGGMVIPRIGMEVIVEHLRGDPDKPIVTGCVYNGQNVPPYNLPEHKTRSTFMTDTHKGQGYNELRFEDERDEEEIFIHGQRDWNTKIERNASTRVNRNVAVSIGHDKASEVENTFRQMVGGDMHFGVGPGKIGSITPSGSAKNTQGIGMIAEGMGDVGSSPGIGNLTMSVEATKTQTIDAHHFETVRKDKTTDVGGHYRLDAGKTIEITAGDSITIKVGKSLLTMDDGGNIALNGKQTNITMDKLLKVLADVIKLN
ncbi:MAG: type VI secretion system tip protein TssI/VgrG [Pseudomonadota bacterium]